MNNQKKDKRYYERVLKQIASSDIKIYRNLKNIFLRGKKIISFLKKGNRFDFSFIIEKDNVIFSPLYSKNDLNIKGKLIQ